MQLDAALSWLRNHALPHRAFIAAYSRRRPGVTVVPIAEACLDEYLQV